MQRYHSSIGIIGPLYSGKSEIRRIFEQVLGYKPLTHSQLLREEIERRGLPLVRDSYTRIYREWVDECGHDVLAKKTLERVPTKSGFVVDGIRHPAELNHYRQNGLGFFAMGVDVSADRETSRRIRYGRLEKMQRDIDRTGWESFVERDSIEWGGVSPLYDIEGAIKLADEQVTNNGTLEDLEKEIKRLIELRNFIHA